MSQYCKISAAIVAESEERSHVLKVDGYSRGKALLKNGKCVISAPFRVGGHTWAVRYYPNGSGKGYADCISLYLLLKSVSAEDVKAKFTLNVLDTNGEPVPSFSITNIIHTFTSKDSQQGFPAFLINSDLEESVHLRDDCLTIRCDVSVFKEIRSEETRFDQFVVVPPSDLHRHLGDLLKNKDAADLQGRAPWRHAADLGGERHSAHRCVLAAPSPVFKAELLGAMKENSGSPIEICDMEADVFESLLHFIYTDSVPPLLESATNKGDVAMAGHLLVAADRYDMGRLKLICEEKLCSHIGSDMVATSLALAEQHGFCGLKEACFQFLASPSNLEAMMASDGYAHLKPSCPSVLKELIARILPAELKAAKDLIMSMV